MWYNYIYKCGGPKAAERRQNLANDQIPVKGDEFYKKLKGGTWIRSAVLMYGEEEYMKQFYLSEIRKNILGTDDDGIFRHKKMTN